MLAESLLTQSQRRRAEHAVAGMANAFAIQTGDVRLVLDELTGPSARVVAIDGSPNGQYAGQYRSIMAERRADPRFFTLEIGDELVDLFEASTEGAYRAMIADARARGITLPDSLALSQMSDDLWTSTLLMGEPLTGDGHVWVTSVCGDSVTKSTFRTDRGGRSFRVRPAVLIAEVEGFA